MKLGWFMACALLAGCASGGSQVGDAATPREQTTRLETAEGTSELRAIGSDPRASFAMAAPPDRVFGALPVAYQELGLTPTTLNTGSRLIGVENAKVRRNLGGTRLSRYLSCGERMGVQVADSDEIFLTLQTQVAAGEGGSGSTLRTVVQASARATGSGGSLINCATTGALEARIVELVKTHAS